METKINVAAIMKNKPQGTKLYDWLHNLDVELDEVATTEIETVIWCTKKDEDYNELFGYSQLGTLRGWFDGLQILFPSKEMRDWSKLAWNTGDILVNKDGNAHVIFEGFDDDTYETFNGNNYLWKNEGITMCFGEYEDELPTSDFSKANKEDAQKYIRQIEKRLGYKLNFETLKIEKSEFKDGDIVTIIPHIGDKLIYLFKAEDDEKYYGHAFLDGNIAIVNEDSYCQKAFCTARPSTDEEKQQLFSALAKKSKAWDAEKKAIVGLKPKFDELKPFDNVLVRHQKTEEWRANIFSHTDKTDEYLDYVCVNGRWEFCIPYAGNEHLLGTTKDVEG